MCQPALEASPPSRDASQRFARDVLALHEKLSFRSLLGPATAARSVHRAVRPDGLVTLALRTDDLESRHLMGCTASAWRSTCDWAGPAAKWCTPTPCSASRRTQQARRICTC
jgi:hypothetical protein